MGSQKLGAIFCLGERCLPLSLRLNEPCPTGGSRGWLCWPEEPLAHRARDRQDLARFRLNKKKSVNLEAKRLSYTKVSVGQNKSPFATRSGFCASLICGLGPVGPICPHIDGGASSWCFQVSSEEQKPLQQEQSKFCAVRSKMLRSSMYCIV